MKVTLDKDMPFICAVCGEKSGITVWPHTNSAVTWHLHSECALRLLGAIMERETVHKVLAYPYSNSTDHLQLKRECNMDLLEAMIAHKTGCSSEEE